ncbi:MAG: hypothetical protein WCJ40_06140 [Planctomycetota bacterium]
MSEATPSGYEMGVKAAGTPAGAQAAYAALPSGGVVAETLLNHRLLAAMPQALSRSKSVINGREEYKRHIFFCVSTSTIEAFSLGGLSQHLNDGIKLC